MKRTKISLLLALVIVITVMLAMTSCMKKEDYYTKDDVGNLILDLQKEIDERTAKNEEKIAALKTAYETKVQELEAENLALGESIDSLNASYTEKVAELESLDLANADALAMLVTEHNEAVANLESKIAENTKKINEEKAALEVSIADLSDRHNSDIAMLNLLIDELKGTDSTNAEKIAALETQIIYLTSQYTVKFDLTGGEGSIPDQNLRRGDKVVKPTDPTRDGYDFDGWYVGDEKWSFIGYTVTENITLTAKWNFHYHTYKNTYSSDETAHWYASTCGHTSLKDQYALHTDMDMDGVCDVCKYVICSHKYATTWSSDNTGHWHAAICGCNKISEYSAHTDDHYDGFCDVCNYQTHTHCDENYNGACDVCGKPMDVYVMSYAEYMAADFNSHVVIEAYVQAYQSWWNDRITVYLADEDGAYLVYEMACSDEDAAKLIPGTKIRVYGYKSAWKGEVEIVDGGFTFVDSAPYIAPAKDVTDKLGTDELFDFQNQLVKFTNMTVMSIEYKNGRPGDDIYIQLEKDGKTYSFCVEIYLTDIDTALYKMINDGEVLIGDVIDVECFLYWYDGMSPHIVSIHTHNFVDGKCECGGIYVSSDIYVPKVGVAYKLFFTQYNIGEIKLYALNTTENGDNRYIETTVDPALASDFYVEPANGGYKIYTIIDGVRYYVHAKVVEDGKISKFIGFATETDSIFVYNFDIHTWSVSIDGTQYGVGTYNNFKTISISELTYFTSNRINVAGGQFPLGLMLSSYAETLAPDVPVNNDPAADSTLTIPQVIELGNTKANNVYTEGKYYVTGTIDEVVKADYGNVYIKDAQGNKLYVYGIYSADGNTRYDQLENPPAVGDTVTLYGSIGKYNDVVQMVNARIISLGGSPSEHIHIYVNGMCECGHWDPNYVDPDYTYPGEEVTVYVTIPEYANSNLWQNANRYDEVFLDSNVVVIVSSTPVGEYDRNSGKYYTSDETWRIYQNEIPDITVTAYNGRKIVSVKITYEVSNTGVLTLDGIDVISGEVVIVDASSITFSVGNTGTSAKGQVRITAIEVVYE